MQTPRHENQLRITHVNSGEGSTVVISSLLPPELERKRLAIARIHNRLIGAVLALMFVGVFSILTVLPSAASRQVRLAAVGVFMFTIAGIGIFSIFRYDNVLSRRLGYLCPYCQAPLYEILPRGVVYEA